MFDSIFPEYRMDVLDVGSATSFYLSSNAKQLFVISHNADVRLLSLAIGKHLSIEIMLGDSKTTTLSSGSNITNYSLAISKGLFHAK